MEEGEREERTAQTKHSQCHFPPSASTAGVCSLILFLHRLHFGILSLTWQFSQYGCPRYTVKPTPAPESNVPSPLTLSSPARVVGSPPERVRKGSPHSAQKKCCSW